MLFFSSAGPINVLNIRLNCFAKVNSFFLQIGHTFPPKESSLNLARQLLHSISGSLNFFKCPEASQTLGFIISEASIPTLSSWLCTNFFHQSCLILFFSS